MGFGERLLEERDKLQEKIEKLELFLEQPNIISKVGSAQEALSNIQHSLMNTYLLILDNRLKIL